VTIHKAKGLQYPLVFLPFICSFRPVDGERLPLSWHDADGRLQTRWTPEPGDLDRADRERLAEDLRLLYVAVTRARHHCWLGIAPVRRGNRKDSQLHLSAVGYLLAGGAPIPGGGLQAALQAAAGGEPGIALIPAPEATDTPLPPEAGEERPGPAREPLRAAYEHWWIASYSALRTGGLSAQGTPAIPGAADTAVEDRFAEAADEPFPEETGTAGATAGGLHRFPRGPGPGTFLHGLLEWAAREGFAAVAGDPALLRDTVARRCRRRGWDHWVEPLSDWLGRLLTDPLELPGRGTFLRLCDLTAYQPELEFWFETRRVDAQRLDRAVCALTLDAAPRPAVLPQLLNGMLKGFIDLVFAIDGRHYTLDYKSNWLGPNAADYTPARMRERVLESRYDLQYVLYSLALHRLLKARLPDYDYERHVGGTVTWFLRGLDAPGRGLHLERPPRELIEELDALVRSAPDAEWEVTP
jgi:exodeoxyribonuclease V beta subunit